MGTSIPASAGGAGVTDSTMVGNGTAGSPYGVNPVAARSPDWYHYCAVLFQQKTGLSPLAIQEEVRDNFGSVLGGIAAPSGSGFVVAGTGAAATRDATLSGAYKMTSTSSGAGQAQWSEDWGTSVNFGQNPQTHRWGIFYRVAIGSAPVAASEVSIGFRSGGTRIGLGYVGAQSAWQYVRGAPGSQTNITSMVKTIDFTGNQWLTMYVGNFDLVNIKANIDVLGGAADVTCEAVSAIPTLPTSGEILVAGVGASDTVYVRNIIYMVELTPTGL